jgi:hypothetical protein
MANSRHLATNPATCSARYDLPESIHIQVDKKLTMYHKKFSCQKHSDLPIRLVTVSAGTIQDFGSTPLGQSLPSMSLMFDFDVYVQADNQQPLASAYNAVIDQCQHDPAILVFVHDDVMITDLFWDHTVRRGLEKFDIVGLAGTTRRHKGQASWCWTDSEMSMPESSQYLSGVVAHGNTWPPHNIGNFGRIGQSCRLMDGLFLAVNSTILHQHNIRFDPQFNFHFYDLDFCRQAEKAGLSMGTVAVSVVHASQNSYTRAWHDAYQKYIAKWND